jgi:hypothetical protein
MATKTCMTCKHWAPDPDGTTLTTGECRRNPPQASGSGRTGWWAMTTLHDWCGEHTGKQGRPPRNAE